MLKTNNCCILLCFVSPVSQMVRRMPHLSSIQVPLVLNSQHIRKKAAECSRKNSVWAGIYSPPECHYVKFCILCVGHSTLQIITILNSHAGELYWTKPLSVIKLLPFFSFVSFSCWRSRNTKLARGIIFVLLRNLIMIMWSIVLYL